MAAALWCVWLRASGQWPFSWLPLRNRLQLLLAHLGDSRPGLEAGLLLLADAPPCRHRVSQVQSRADRHLGLSSGQQLSCPCHDHGHLPLGLPPRAAGIYHREQASAVIAVGGRGSALLAGVASIAACAPLLAPAAGRYVVQAAAVTTLYRPPLAPSHGQQQPEHCQMRSPHRSRLSLSRFEELITANTWFAHRIDSAGRELPRNGAEHLLRTGVL